MEDRRLLLCLLLPVVLVGCVSANRPRLDLAKSEPQPVREIQTRRLPAVAETAAPTPVVQQVDYQAESFEALPEIYEVPGEVVLHEGENYPLDLANALRLGGASNLQIRLARSRIAEAQARHLEARSLWLPSLRAGVGYNKHDGRLQETEGNVIEVSRSSLFYGGGAGLGGTPLPGGAGGPPRLFVNLSLADAAFEPLVASQRVRAAAASEGATFNNTLLAIATAYFNLVEAHGQRANQQLSLDAAQQMVEQVATFEQSGYSTITEVHRAKTDLASRQRAVEDADRRAIGASAELARLIRLPAQVRLVPVEEFVMPIDFIDADLPVDALISQALGSRPEVTQAQAALQAACWRTRHERLRPWIPNVQVGVSAGSFGGGTGSDYENDAGRSDVDLLAVWEVRNLGLGNVALLQQARTQLHQSELDVQAVRDTIAAEVVTAHADVQSYQRQLDIASEAINAAQESYRLNASRIREGEGLPIELIQSISALVSAQNAHTRAAADYNRAQYRLLRAIGQPPS